MKHALLVTFLLPVLTFSQMGMGKGHSKKTFNLQWIFDYHIQSDKIKEQANDMHRTFTQKRKILQNDIRHYEQRIEMLIKQQKNGMDHHQEIADTLIKLQELSKELHILARSHNEKLFEILDSAYLDYEQNVNKAINSIQKTPDLFMKELLERYESFETSGKKKK
ncbi:MAG: hypothetical protein ACRCS8_05460 [Brevinema sp.]